MSDPVTFTSAPAHQTMSALTSRLQHVWPSDLHLCPRPPNHVSPYFKAATCLTQWPSPLPPPTKPYQPLLQGCNMSDPATFTSAPALTSRMQHVWPHDLHLCPLLPAHQTMSALTSRMQRVWPSDLHLCPLPPPTKPCQPLLQGCSMSDPMTFTSAPSSLPTKPCQPLLQGCSMSDPVTFTSAPSPHPPNHVNPYFKDAACLTQWPHISPPPPPPTIKPCQPILHCCNMSDLVLLVSLPPCQLLSQGCNTSDPMTSILSPPPPRPSSCFPQSFQLLS